MEGAGQETLGWGWLLLAALLKIVFVLVVLLTYAPILVWAERRQSAMMQDRVGPMQGGIPMPRFVLDLIPTLQLGAFAVAALTGLYALFEIVGNIAAYDIRLSWLGVLCAVLSVVHVGLGQILPSLFHNGRLTAFGLIHPLADAIKMIFKEDLVPPKADKFLFSIAPILATVPAFAVFAVIPFGPTLYLDYLFQQLPPGGLVDGPAIPLQIASINVGILFIFAIAGTGIIGAAVAGYSSDNKYALLGGLRAASQMVSYEVVLGLSVVPMFMIYDSLLLQDMVAWQRTYAWGIFLNPIAFLMFQTAAIAEYKRVPFDAPEGESEIVAGYFLEYSGMKWGMYMMGEFIEVVTSSALLTVIFLGGWDVPFLTEGGWEAYGYRFDLTGTDWEILSDIANSHIFVTLVCVLAFLLKVGALCFISLQIRWTLPRFRYDQIMQMCWKLLLPLALANILLTGLVVLAWQSWWPAIEPMLSGWWL